MKKILAFALSAIVGVSALSGCSEVEHRGRGERKVVRVGVTGTDGDAWEILKRKAEKELKLNWLSSLITQRQIKL